MIGILKGLKTTFQTHFRKPVTVQYPDEHLPLAPRYMGFPGLLYDDEVKEPLCVGCMVCERNCPTECITVTMRDNPKFADGTSKRRKIVGDFSIDLSRCILCAICVEVCAFDAIEMTWTHEVASQKADGMVADLPRLIEMWRESVAAKAKMREPTERPAA